MSIPTTGVILVDIIVGAFIFISSSAFCVEVYKSVVGSIQNRAKEKSAEKKNILVKQELYRRAALHWELVAHEAVRVGVENGIPRSKFPDMSPPTSENPVIRTDE